MPNPSFASSNSPKHSSSSSESASSDCTPSPPPSLVLPPLPFPIHPLPPQVFIFEEVAPFDWSNEEEQNSEEFWLRAKDDVEDAATAAFMDAPIRRKRRRRLARSSLESSVLGLFDFKESDSSDSPSKGSSDGSDSGNDEGKQEEEDEDDDDEEEMECQAPDYPQEDSGDDMDAYALRSP